MVRIQKEGYRILGECDRLFRSCSICTFVQILDPRQLEGFPETEEGKIRRIKDNINCYKKHDVGMSETLGSGRQLLLFPFLGHNHPLTETEADQSMQFLVYQNFFQVYQ